MLTKTTLGADEQRERALTRRAALMVAEGTKSNKEIASELNVSLAVLETWRRSPLFMELVDTYADKIEDQGIKSIVADVQEDGPKNLSFLKRTRDGEFSDDKDRMNVRLTASRMLWDKQVPNAGNNVSDGAVQLVVSGKLLGQMLRAMQNDGAIDITPEDIDDHETVPVRTPEEVIARLQEQQRLLEEEDGR